jgi:hypothetical protein
VTANGSALMETMRPEIADAAADHLRLVADAAPTVNIVIIGDSLPRKTV